MAAPTLPQKPSPARRWLGLALRLVLAIAGVSFIVLSLSWRDQVVIPAGWQLADGTVLREPLRRTVIEHAEGVYLLKPYRAGGEPIHMPEVEVIDSPDTPRVVPGIFSLVAGAQWAWVAGGGVVFGTMFLLQSVRWLVLMRCRGLAVPWGRCMRLVMVGQFFNICLPGSTGGDVARAYYAARGTDHRSVAVMSVLFDRVAGLVGMVLLAALMGLLLLDRPMMRWITLGLWAGLAALAVGGAVYFSPIVRGWIKGGMKKTEGGRQKSENGGAGVSEKGPYPSQTMVDGRGPSGFRLQLSSFRLSLKRLTRSLDAAAVAYRDHKPVIAGAIGISLVVHLALASSVVMAGYGLGLEAPLGLLLTVLPISFLAGALPLTPLGLGVIEGVGVALLTTAAGSETTVVLGMFLGLRVYQVFYGLLGSLALLGGDIRLYEEGVGPRA